MADLINDRELQRIWSKTDDEKLAELLDRPDDYCRDYIYLIDYHLGKNLGKQMRDKLVDFKRRIESNQDLFVLEELANYGVEPTGDLID